MRRDPDLGIFFEIVAVGVRSERQIACGGQGNVLAVMALLAGFQPVIGVNGRFRIVHAENLMTAVAVGTLRRMAITQCIDLAMVGIAVGFKSFLMTIAAGFCDP